MDHWSDPVWHFLCSYGLSLLHERGASPRNAARPSRAGKGACFSLKTRPGTLKTFHRCKQGWFLIATEIKGFF